MAGSVDAYHCPAGFEAQCEQALGVAEEAHVNGMQLQDIAVLCLRNDECAEAARIFRAGGLPVFLRGQDEYSVTPTTLLVEALAAWTAPAARDERAEAW